MSGVAVIRYLLGAASAVTAIVPNDRIAAGTLPLGAGLPAIAVAQISGVEQTTVSMRETTGRLREDRVQVTVYATGYPEQRQLIELIRTACRNQSGTVNGVSLDSILPGGIGPDSFDADAKIYEQTIDYIVRWRSS